MCGCVWEGGGSVFTPASGPLSRTMWSQVVRVLLGLIHNVSQVHAVNTAHCKISTKNPSSETFTSLKVCVFVDFGGLTLALWA